MEKGIQIKFWIKIAVIICLTGGVLAPCAAYGKAIDYHKLRQKLVPLIGPKDAVAVASQDGTHLIAIHADKLLVPASILKTLTAAAALHHLGKDYHYATDFYLDDKSNLTIKGYGDPLLVSERLQVIAQTLSERIQHIENLILDDHYFAYPVSVPGRSISVEPYDAPNGALCVNFNTVFFKKEKFGWVSAEPQTPLMPMIIPKIKASGLESGRITLAADRNESLKYAGALFSYFLNKAGIRTSGVIEFGVVDMDKDKLLWRHISDKALTDIIADLMEFSNNFIANQLLLTMGAKVYGPPATLGNGLQVLRTYSSSVVGLKTGNIAEASGLSRQNRISANGMLKVLEHFSPYHYLMRHKGRQWYKTGTLKGVHTRAGFLDSVDGDRYRFVVMINTPGKKTDKVMETLLRELK